MKREQAEAISAAVQEVCDIFVRERFTRGDAMQVIANVIGVCVTPEKDNGLAHELVDDIARFAHAAVDHQWPEAADPFSKPSMPQ